MSVEEDTTQNNVIDVVTSNPSVIFDGSVAFETFFDEFSSQALAVGCDVSRKKSRDAIKSIAATVSRMKSSIDEAGKERNAALRKRIDAVDAIRREVRGRMDALKADVRRPLDQWEMQEAARIESHSAVIKRLAEAAAIGPDETSAQIKARIEDVSATDVSPAALQEFSEQAKAKQESALAVLQGAFVRIKQQEEERAELERLRQEAAEREERDRRERAARELAEREATDAAARAERDREIALAAERRAKAASEQAIRDAEAAAAKRQREMDEAHAAELRRIAAEREAERLDMERREAARIAADRAEQVAAEARRLDQEHREAVLRGAAEAIMRAASIGEDRARKVVQAICAGEIPNVSIRF